MAVGAVAAHPVSVDVMVREGVGEGAIPEAVANRIERVLGVRVDEQYVRRAMRQMREREIL